MAHLTFPDLLGKAQEFSEALLELDFELAPGFDRDGSVAAWTGNALAEKEFAIFGQDLTGSLVGFWLQDDCDLDESPVVFLGSDGVTAVIASNLREFLGLLALGCSPYSLATDGITGEERPVRQLLKWLERETGEKIPSDPLEIVDQARRDAPDLKQRLRELRQSTSRRQVPAVPRPPVRTQDGGPPPPTEFCRELEQARDPALLSELVVAYQEVESVEVLPALFRAVERCAETSEDDELEAVDRYLQETFLRSEYLPEAKASFRRAPSRLTLEIICAEEGGLPLLEQALAGKLPEELAETVRDRLEWARECEEAGDRADESDGADEDRSDIWAEWEIVDDTLDLRDQDRSSVDSRDLSHLAAEHPELRFLRCCEVAPPALPLLSQLTKLEGVELETQFPNPSAAREYLHQLPAIASLLRGLHIGSIRNKDLQLIGGLRQLEVLRIQCSEIRDYAFAPLSQLEQLRELTLSQNPKLLGTGLAHVPAGGLQLLDVAEIGGSFESDGAKRLGAATCRAIARFRDLKELTLSLNYFEPGATQPLEALTSLETLNAMSCGWSAADLKFLTSLRGLKRLRLNGNPLDDSAAHTLRRLDALEELWLKDSKVTDAAIEVLVGLPQLRELGLCRTRVTDQGVAALARARSLRRLSIDGGEITERALSHLTALPLRELDIGRKCKVSKSARDALTKALPGCTVREAW